MRVLLQILSEGPPALASLLSPVFLYILDSPSTRKYFRPGKDLEVRKLTARMTCAYACLLSQTALSGVTDAYGKDLEHQRRLKDICRSIVCMLRTWSGMFIY